MGMLFLMLLYSNFGYTVDFPTMRASPSLLQMLLQVSDAVTITIYTK
jgi:hypothetical protein